MGDVFDAMNRAKRDQGEPKGEPRADGAPPPDDVAADVPAQPSASPAEPTASRPAPAAPRHETGGLPIDDMQDAGDDIDAALADTDKDKTPPPPLPRGAQPVADAAARSRFEEEQTDDKDEIDPLTGAHVGLDSLNGYSADVVVHHDRGSIITEQYRAVRTQILARSRNRRVQTHVITSSAPEEGKSVTTVNLGVAFSELRSQRTLLVEGDLRRPSFNKLFDRQTPHGLLHWLRGEVDDLEEIICPTVYDNLQFLPAGGKEFAHSTELLSSPRMTQMLEWVKDRYDHIFIDTPPVITVTDACILGAMCDQTLLVIRLHRTPTEVVDRAKRLLRAANCEIAGVVLTHMEMELSRYLYRYGYTYT